ncbi:QueT transporter family protein [Ruminococcus sp. Marseille-P6503]|uniref:QueT transporter family protein n=1 Tax=Ruminococcus sp. Marseille-P6503 TaxID=2364796 RepID=UPI000F53A244|nr:QueT transporter family protein [Ruminococcus sp. Marseille-P6503]
MEIFNSRRITNIGVVAAIYVVITLVGGGLAYGQVQFRVSEALVLLCFFNKDYILSMSIGCFIANLFSTVGLIDTVVGTAATIISVALIYVCRNRLNLFAVSLFPVLFNAVFVGAELKFVANLPFFASAAGVALGEFVCVSVLGVVLIRALSKNKRFMKLIMAGHNADSLS